MKFMILPFTGSQLLKHPFGGLATIRVPKFLLAHVTIKIIILISSLLTKSTLAIRQSIGTTTTRRFEFV